MLGGERLMNRKWLFVIFILSVLGIGSAGMGISQIEDSIKEGDTSFYVPGSTYYLIKGVPDKNKIAIEIVRKELKKYQVLEKGHPIPK